MRRWLGNCGAALLVGIAIVLIVALPSLAADYKPAAKPDWTVTLGVEGRYLPAFEGSDAYEFFPFPLFDVRRAGTPARFRSPRDGASIGIWETDKFRFGPTLKVKLPRDQDDHADLRGLGDVDWAVELGVFAEYWPRDWLRGRVELRQGIGGHDGLVADVLADVVVPVTPKLTLSAGPRLSIESKEAVSPYFSITSVQSAASGLPVYDAGGGVHAYGAGAQARYQWNTRWASHVFVEYKRLAGDAADSPLVVQRGTKDQFQVGIGLSYSFDVPALW